ncbi:hypothetical protein CONPUDRAFT_155811 [Coniophora puteana RWD-64-598 SS2]|uniref:Uncharacterized protein n=1 Tax=Coniophora puteana (strain RWD-64-598) TaxID=741705 RepID=A0A5M3MJA4_CONPW|nr:uncharacterized protein CONPUDRAFT_155811 [Coniophora puteana RWD-64-598 SS2]EIW79126.1 hypothetical protein CONPUDRAFT_155811 [Coniophora puteana RWD-64-598 SS2]
MPRPRPKPKPKAKPMSDTTSQPAFDAAPNLTELTPAPVAKPMSNPISDTAPKSANAHLLKAAEPTLKPIEPTPSSIPTPEHRYSVCNTTPEPVFESIPSATKPMSKATPTLPAKSPRSDSPSINSMVSQHSNKTNSTSAKRLTKATNPKTGK